MSRVYGEPADVQTKEDGRPVRFVWRGRLYTVRVIIEHWVINRDWWHEDAPCAEPGTESGMEPAAGPAPEEHPLVRVPEQEHWRVEASPGQGVPSGVYELRQEAGAWTLRRVID